MCGKHFEQMEQKPGQWNEVRPERGYSTTRQQGQLRMEMLGFMAHFVTYFSVNALQVGIYLLTTFGAYPWFIWGLFGWGIGLAAHGIKVANLFFRSNGISYRQFVEREVYRGSYEPRPYQYPAANQPTTGWPETNSDQSRF